MLRFPSALVAVTASEFLRPGESDTLVVFAFLFVPIFVV